MASGAREKEAKWMRVRWKEDRKSGNFILAPEVEGTQAKWGP